VTKSLNVGANVIYVSGSYCMAMRTTPIRSGGTNGEGAFIEGSGWLAGYTLVNLRGTYRISKHAEIFARVVNVLNVNYATGRLPHQQFLQSQRHGCAPTRTIGATKNAVSPGAPRGIWAGVRVRF